MAKLMEKLVWSLGDIAVVLDMSKVSLWKVRKKDKSFPLPINLDMPTPKFMKEDILNWLESKKQEATV